jgi:hypothetical protein
MGGEFLTDEEDDEVEIARVSLMSTTGDQISVRAFREREKIGYKVVDEYDSLFDLAFQESNLPLTLGEMIDFLDGTEDGGYDEKGGLVQAFWIQNSPEFATVESAFYSELSGYYEKLGYIWEEVQ